MMKTHSLLIIAIFIAVAMGACKSPNDTNVQAYADTSLLKDTINDAIARRLVTNYNGRAHIIRNHQAKDMGVIFPDTRCVWFSINQLRALVQRVDSEKGDGIRFYLAAYDSLRKPDLPKIREEYLNYSTLIMVSTRYDSLNKIHADYYKTLKNANGKKGAIIMSVPENQGELCPPPAHCITAGASLLPN